MKENDRMTEITYAQAIKDAMCEEMRRDASVFLLGEDVGKYGGAFGVTRGMLEEFGEERVRDTPISEAAITGCAVGAAMTGMRPIVEIMFSDFITIAMDQLVNQAAKARYQFGGQASIPMVLRAPEGSGTGAAAQHSQSIESWILNVPGLKVVAPSTPADAKGLLTASIRDDNPVVFLEQKLLYRKKGLVPEGEHVIPLGKADVKRQGEDITIISYGRMVERCLEAAVTLAASGIEAEVIDLRTLRPLDTDTIVASARRTGRVLIVHEACRFGGFGGEIAATICDSEAFYYLDAPVRRLAGRDTPIPYNKTLEAAVVPTAELVVQAVRDLAG
jgi:acetoin:2,6-dichlorophenolindophenol oxidoreductase subunit beta